MTRKAQNRRRARELSVNTPRPSFPDDNKFDPHEFDPWDEELWDEIVEVERALRAGDHAQCPTADELAALCDSLPVRNAHLSQLDFET